MIIPNYHITIGNATDVGKVREYNEDYMAHFDTPLGYCVIVCDGMGGHAAGDVASQNGIASIRKFLEDVQNENTAIPLALKNAIEFANYQLREMVNQNIDLKGMGTTCVLALIDKGQLYIAHVGDSRIYLISKNKIRQITKDHSVIQKLIDTGALTEAEAQLSEKKNQITKAIGIFEKANPTVAATSIALCKNDKILLCSDGLTGHINNETITETILSGSDVQKAASKLVEQANEQGGTDNITVQLVHYTGKTKSSKKKKFSKLNIVAAILMLLLFLGSVWGYRKYYGNKLQTSDSTKTSSDSTKTRQVSPKRTSTPDNKEIKGGKDKRSDLNSEK